MLSRRTMIRAFGCAGLAGLPGPPVAAQSKVVSGSSFGLKSDGRTDEAAPLQAALDSIARAGGGELSLAQGATTKATAAPILPEGVSLDLNGGTLLLALGRGDQAGVRLRSGATLRNGIVQVRSTGTPGVQAGVHAPVVVGALYGEGGTVENTSPDEGVSGWTIRDLVLSSDKDVRTANGQRFGAVAIQVVGGACRGTIENIVVPDSPVMAGGVHLDWGTVGPLESADIMTDAGIAGRGQGYTTHPHDIVIRMIRIGRLTRSQSSGEGSHGIRLSGAYNIHVSDVIVEAITAAGFRYTAGDLGFEFARAADKEQACRGIHFENGELRDALTGYLIHSDSFADNVARAAAEGYRPMLDPIYSTDILFRDIRGTAREPGVASYGVRVDHQRGGRIVDCVAQGFKRGFYIDEQVTGLELIRPVATDSAEAGISVEHPSRPPRDVLIEDAIARHNGRAAGGGASGILIGRSDNVEVRGGEAPVDAIQKHGIRITPDARRGRATDGAAAQVSGPS